MNVQCENCHGPAKTHVDKQNYLKHRSLESMTEEQRNKIIAEAKAAVPPAKVGEVCTKCHYSHHDPNFVYDVKIHKVNHKGDKQADAAPPKSFRTARAKRPSRQPPAGSNRTGTVTDSDKRTRRRPPARLRVSIFVTLLA